MRAIKDYESLRENYDISPSGEVYSKLRKRYLKPSINNCGYIMYFLQPCKKWFSCHSLVAYFYIGPRPKGYDINHIDGNKGNNHFSNLEYITHSENVRKDYQNGHREHVRKILRQTRPSLELETRLKMADAKKKGVKVIQDGSEVIYNSIDEACKGLNWYREKFYRKVKPVFSNDNLHIERLQA